MQICVLVGNPKAGSRTMAASQALATQLAGPTDTVEVIDLADHADALFVWPSERMDDLIQTAANSDILIVGSPTYKATYTGLLKSFLDRYSAGGLGGVRAVPLMTGADRGHAMAPDVNLRPLLVELGASVPTASLYIDMTSFGAFDELLADWIQRNASLLQTTDAPADKVSA